MIQQVSPQELQEWINHNKSFLLVDVREDFERELYNIGGVHIPLGELIQRRNELSQTEPIVFYCEKGIRSMIALQRLEGFGFNNIFNLAGGMYAWRAM